LAIQLTTIDSGP